jgi:hypothetical protein
MKNFEGTPAKLPQLRSKICGTRGKYIQISAPSVQLHSARHSRFILSLSAGPRQALTISARCAQAVQRPLHLYPLRSKILWSMWTDIQISVPSVQLAQRPPRRHSLFPGLFSFAYEMGDFDFSPQPFPLRLRVFVPFMCLFPLLTLHS